MSDAADQLRGIAFVVVIALPLLVAAAVLAAFGYDPAAEVAATAVQARLMAIYGGVPALLMGVGALFLRGFPVTRERHAAVRAELAKRAGCEQ
jgi:Na+/melibiose symporter-like transporter